MKIRRATLEDIEVLSRLQTDALSKMEVESDGLLTISEYSRNFQQEYRSDLSSENRTWWIAEGGDSGEIAAVKVWHLQGAVPVYDPGRSILCVQNCLGSTRLLESHGTQLIDAVVTWAFELSALGALLLCGVTWGDSSILSRILRNYHRASAICSNPRYRSLFYRDSSDTANDRTSSRCTPASRWYFGDARTIKANSLQSGILRRAEPTDVAEMVRLSRLKRMEYATKHPIFWRPADNADSLQREFFKAAIADAKQSVFVSQLNAESSSPLNGFIIGISRTALPFMDLSMKDGMHVDDFAIDDAGSWNTVGTGLLFKAIGDHRLRSGLEHFTVNIVSGDYDLTKSSFLEGSGFKLLYRWEVLPS